MAKAPTKGALSSAADKERAFYAAQARGITSAKKQAQKTAAEKAAKDKAASKPTGNYFLEPFRQVAAKIGF